MSWKKKRNKDILRKKETRKESWLTKERKKIDELKQRENKKKKKQWKLTNYAKQFTLISDVNRDFPFEPGWSVGLGSTFLSSHWLCCRSRESFWHDQALSAFILVHLISLPENNADNRSANGRSLTYCHWIFIGLPILLRNIIKRSAGVF